MDHYQTLIASLSLSENLRVDRSLLLSPCASKASLKVKRQYVRTRSLEVQAAGSYPGVSIVLSPSASGSK